MTVTQAQLRSLTKFVPEKSPTQKKGLGSDAFMTLFVAQFKNQDPMNPVSNKDSTAQLTQFAQLEQLTMLTTLMQGMVKGNSLDRTIKAAGMIGKGILADGNAISKDGDKVSSVNLHIPKGATSVKVNIHDKSGNIVRTVDLGKVKDGEQKFIWDGKNTSGKEMSDGIYKMSIVAENAHGQRMMVRTQVEGKVEAVEVENGKQVLVLTDNRRVFLDQVWKIVASND